MPRISGLRQLYHSLSGISLVLIASYLEKFTVIYLILILFIIALVIESARLYLPWMNRRFINYFGFLMRSEEKHNPTGTLYYLSGVLISFLLFPKEIALFSMTVLAVGDPAAYIIGSNFGRVRIGKKSLEGSLAFLITSAIAGILLHTLWKELSVLAVITGAVTGAVVELVPLKINDNLTIPVTASATTYAILLFLV